MMDGMISLPCHRDTSQEDGHHFPQSVLLPSERDALAQKFVFTLSLSDF